MPAPLRILCIGGGPAGLYFAMLAKKADPARVVRVVERNRALPLPVLPEQSGTVSVRHPGTRSQWPRTSRRVG